MGESSPAALVVCTTIAPLESSRASAGATGPAPIQADVKRAHPVAIEAADLVASCSNESIALEGFFNVLVWETECFFVGVGGAQAVTVLLRKAQTNKWERRTIIRGD